MQFFCRNAIKSEQHQFVTMYHGISVLNCNKVLISVLYALNNIKSQQKTVDSARLTCITVMRWLVSNCSNKE